MKVLLINPPRYYWPYLNEGDNYLLPQALPCLSAVLRENDIDVKPIDCLPLKIGWKSLRHIVEKEKPDVVGVCVSESMFSHEAIRAFEMIKDVDPKIITIAGGHHFSNMIETTLKNNQVDFIVIGEGEYTLLEMVKELEKAKSVQNFKNVKGIAFKKDNKIIRTKSRPLINNLNELPIPAYDLMPMKEYGKSPLLWSPGGTTIHHSRGCTGSCSFCACWVHMGKRVNGKLLPFWRTKSVERTIEEVELLYKKYKKKYLVFVDDTWNVDPKWNETFSDKLKENNININWHAFIRADFLLRDEKLGILKKMVDAGMSHVCIGAERYSSEDLVLLNKPEYTKDIVKKCFHILRDKYPSVFRQSTFVVGFKNETKTSLNKTLEYAKELDVDFPSFHPITPVPGTKLWDLAIKNNWLEEKDFRFYDWMTPLMSSETLSRDEIEKEILEMNRKYITPKRVINGLLSKSSYKRMLYLWCIVVTSKLGFHEIKNNILPENWFLNKKESTFTYMVKPKWYDR